MKVGPLQLKPSVGQRSVEAMNRGVSVRARLIATAVSVFTTAACVFDMFQPTARITGAYSLMSFESGISYYICKGEHCGGESGGILDGAVSNVGWSDRYLIVFMTDPAKPGWRVVDVASGEVLGPLDALTFYRLCEKRPELAAIEVLHAHEAWKKLKRW